MAVCFAHAVIDKYTSGSMLHVCTWSLEIGSCTHLRVLCGKLAFRAVQRWMVSEWRIFERNRLAILAATNRIVRWLLALRAL